MNLTCLYNAVVPAITFIQPYSFILATGYRIIGGGEYLCIDHHHPMFREL